MALRSEHVRPRASLNERARREACRLVGKDGLDVAAVADLLGVGWNSLLRAFAEYGSPLVEDPGRPAGRRRRGGGRRDRVPGRRAALG